MMKNSKSVGVLVAICTVVALLLAVTNQFTAPIIEKNQSAAANEALLEVMPDGAGFELVDVSGKTLPATVTEAYKETSGKGYVIKLTTTGYGTDMVIMCGVSADGKVTGAVCLSSNETLGKEKEYGANFAGKDAAGVDATDTIAGATMTTAAYKGAVKDAVNTAAILGGGDVDIRTPEQILADNLAKALPAGEGKFTKLFFTEVIEGVDAVYSADNGAGHVAVIGEEFIGIETNAPTAYPAIADAIKAMTEDIPTDVDLTAYEGINENVVAVKKTASGNYDITVNARGYAYYDDNHGYGQQRFVPIVIRVSLTADGTIIDCMTVSHEESKGIGDACATEEFYGQFDGKTADTYTEVDGIAGATITTEGPKGNEGYMAAILRCFETVSILEGGAKS